MVVLAPGIDFVNSCNNVKDNVTFNFASHTEIFKTVIKRIAILRPQEFRMVMTILIKVLVHCVIIEHQKSQRLKYGHMERNLKLSNNWKV